MINDYMFDGNGNLNIKYTDDLFDRIIIKESESTKANKIEPQKGVVREGENLVIRLDKNVIDEDETRTQYRMLTKYVDPFNPKKNNDYYALGTKITITDNDQIDKIFKTLATNSEVEYAMAKYDKNGKIKNDIWTSKQRYATSREPLKKLADSYKISEYAHSHPIRDPKIESSKAVGPSYEDINMYKQKKSEMDRNPNMRGLTHKVYSPAFSDSYFKYDANGIINKKDIPLDNIENLNKKLGQNFENYRNKRDNLITPLYEPKINNSPYKLKINK